MQTYITLSALSEKIRMAVELSVDAPQWVVAEVSQINVNFSGHCYLELVERVEGEAAPRASVRAVIWARNYRLMASYFKSQTGSEIRQGMKLMINCSPTYHAVYGLSLTINDIDPTYTVGEVERQRQITIARLEAEGVFGMNKDFDLEPVIQRLAVVSSATAAGYEDFMKQLDSSPYRFEVDLYQATMQGTQSEESIIEALDFIASQEIDYQAVVIIRGGGSQNDLACFNGYDLCSNIAQYPLPIFTGIGHERDVSVADLVACRSMKTPTAVAAALIEWAAIFTEKLQRMAFVIDSQSKNILMAESRRLENLEIALSSLITKRLHGESLRIATLGQRIEASTEAFFQRSSTRLQTVELWLAEQPLALIERQRKRLEILELKVEARNPRRILKLGYAIIGGGIRSVSDLVEGKSYSIEMADGHAEAKIENIQENGK